MKKVPTTSGDYLVSLFLLPTPGLTILSNEFMRNGTYPLMFIGRVYNTNNGLQIQFVNHYTTQSALYVVFNDLQKILNEIFYSTHSWYIALICILLFHFLPWIFQIKFLPILLLSGITLHYLTQRLNFQHLKKKKN